MIHVRLKGYEAARRCGYGCGGDSTCVSQMTECKQFEDYQYLESDEIPWCRWLIDEGNGDSIFIDSNFEEVELTGRALRLDGEVYILDEYHIDELLIDGEKCDVSDTEDYYFELYGCG